MLTMPILSNRIQSFKFEILTLILLTISAFLFLHFATYPQQATTQTETFTYTLTNVNDTGYYGEALDGTGVFFTNDYTQQELHKGDTIKVTFEDYEIITNVELIQ